MFSCATHVIELQIEVICYCITANRVPHAGATIRQASFRSIPLARHHYYPYDFLHSVLDVPVRVINQVSSRQTHVNLSDP
jgi:hypothetical protein